MGNGSEKPRLVLVEDSDNLREAVREMLEGVGFEVSDHARADEAFAEILARRPNVVLTDIMMADGPEGLGLITRICTDLSPPIPPVVAFSGVRELRAEVLRRGGAAFLPKPADPATLLATLDSVMAGTAPGHSQQSAAAERAVELRKLAHRAAKAALESLGAGLEELKSRARHATVWLPAYLGFGRMACLVLQAEPLVLGSGEGEDDGSPYLQWKDLACDVAETGSRIALPDARLLSGATLSSRAWNIGHFAGVPFFGRGQVPIGALCLFDEQPHWIEIEELALLDEMGGRASLRLGGIQSLNSQAFFADSGLLSRSTFELLLKLELDRSQRRPLAVHLAVCAADSSVALPYLADSLTAALGAERFGIAELGPCLLGLLFARDADGAGERFSRGLEALQRERSLQVALVSVDTEGLPAVESTQLLQWTEALVKLQVAQARRQVDRLSIRRL